MRKIAKIILFPLLTVFLVLFSYFFIGATEPATKITWGVNFSQRHAQKLGLNWKETYSALLDDLGVRNLKIAADWDLLQTEKDSFRFDDLDWQIGEAQNRGAKIILVIGMKTGRWPECHLPQWAINLDKSQQQEAILSMLREVVLRYRDSEAIKYWQVENEPFFPFGECQWSDKEFLKKEVELVKSVDNQKKPVIISDSGEISLWIQAARFGDVVGATMYKEVWFTPFRNVPYLTWFRQLGMYLKYPFPPVFYQRKAQIIKKFFSKEVICVELQAEPWGPLLLYDLPLAEQKKTMNLEQFKYNIEFAKKTGLKEFYLWGSEWWFWMKTKQNSPEIWQEVRTLF